MKYIFFIISLLIIKENCFAKKLSLADLKIDKSATISRASLHAETEKLSKEKEKATNEKIKNDLISKENRWYKIERRNLERNLKRKTNLSSLETIRRDKEYIKTLQTR